MKFMITVSRIQYSRFPAVLVTFHEIHDGNLQHSMKVVLPHPRYILNCLHAAHEEPTPENADP